MTPTDPMTALMMENHALRARLRARTRSWGERIDDFVDEWFERNRDEVDVGRIEILGRTVDLFPNWLEKHVYKKLLKIAYSFVRAHAAGDPDDESSAEGADAV